MACRVLVEEPVEVDDPGLPDPRLAVDERDLAEVRRPVVGRQLAAHDVGAGLGLDVDDPTALEPQLEPPDDAAVERQRPGRPDDALGAA